MKLIPRIESHTSLSASLQRAPSIPRESKKRVRDDSDDSGPQAGNLGDTSARRVRRRDENLMPQVAGAAPPLRRSARLNRGNTAGLNLRQEPQVERRARQNHTSDDVQLVGGMFVEVDKCF
jgi:hypothetical protein